MNMKKVVIRMLVLLMAVILVFTSCNTSEHRDDVSEKKWEQGDYDEFYSRNEKTSVVSEPASENSDSESMNERIVRALISGYKGIGLDLITKGTSKDVTTFELHSSDGTPISIVAAVCKNSDWGKSPDTGVYAFVEGLPVGAFSNNEEFVVSSFTINAFALAFYINEMTGSTIDGKAIYDEFYNYTLGSKNINILKGNDGKNIGMYTYFTVCGIECLYVNYLTGFVIACDEGINNVIENFESVSNIQKNTGEPSADNTDKSFGQEEQTTKKPETVTQREPSTQSSHVHSYVNHDGKKATCTERGYESYRTCDCGYSDYSEIPALGHDYALFETKKPTCETEGYDVYRCVNCNDNYKSTKGALGHNYKESTCTAPKTCRTCGVTTGIPAGHSMDFTECENCNFVDYSPIVFSSSTVSRDNSSTYHTTGNVKTYIEDGDVTVSIDKNGRCKVRFAEYSFDFTLGEQKHVVIGDREYYEFSILFNGKPIAAGNEMTFYPNERCSLSVGSFYHGFGDVQDMFPDLERFFIEVVID